MEPSTSRGSIVLAVNDSNEGIASKIKFGNAVTLQEDGKNFLAWKVLVPGYMQSEPWAWEVLRPVDPITPDSDPEHYKIGNKNARTVFFSIVHPNIILSLFYDDSETVSATDMWKQIKERFQNQGGLYREQAIASWLAFEFLSSKTVEQNLDT